MPVKMPVRRVGTVRYPVTIKAILDITAEMEDKPDVDDSVIDVEMSLGDMWATDIAKELEKYLTKFRYRQRSAHIGDSSKEMEYPKLTNIRVKVK